MCKALRSEREGIDILTKYVYSPGTFPTTRDSLTRANLPQGEATANRRFARNTFQLVDEPGSFQICLQDEHAVIRVSQGGTLIWCHQTLLLVDQGTRRTILYL